jgi:hypothetical protein
MPHYNTSARGRIADIGLGIRVDRATATLPQTTAAAIFNIVGGRVQVTGILGEVTTILGAVGNMSLESNPTTGTTAALCAVLAAGALEAGTLLSISGLKATAMYGVDAGGSAMQHIPVALPVGTLDLRLSGSSTGSVKWSIWYVPLDDGAYITAA